MASARFEFTDGSIDIRAGQHPVVIQIGDHFAHEGFGQLYGAIPIAKVLHQYCKRELLRTLALVGLFEAPACEALDVIVLVEPYPILGDNQTVDRSLAFKRAHGCFLGYGLAE